MPKPTTQVDAIRNLRMKEQQLSADLAADNIHLRHLRMKEATRKNPPPGDAQEYPHQRAARLPGRL
jgi:hypothetical protein